MFEALLSRHEAKIKRERLNTGIIAAMIYNTAPFADSKREPLHPMDFVPGETGHKADLTQLSPEEQQAYFDRAFFKNGVEKGKK